MNSITIPADLWDDDSPGVVSVWFFDDGDEVEADTVVAEVMNEKVSFEITAGAVGRLKIDCPVESEVSLGQVIGFVNA